MEQEFNFDQEDVKVTVVEEVEETEEAGFSDFSKDDFATADESEIDWSIL